MSHDVFTYLVGGKAGEGVKKAGSVAANLFAEMGRSAFQYDDYQSLIRGGHNFSVVTTAAREVGSHYGEANLIVVLDAPSYEKHRDSLAPGGVLVCDPDSLSGVGGTSGSGVGTDGPGTVVTVPIRAEAASLPFPELRVGVAGAATLCAVTGLTAADLEELIRAEYPRDLENNVSYGRAIYDAVLSATDARFPLERGEHVLPILAGNECIALGAVAAGLDIYAAYPMTPSSSLLHFLAKHDDELGVTVMHPESEIAVANIAVGAAAMGARAMVGSSGGGFALMEEALSFAGMAEVPLLCMLSARLGPSTGVPTYTEQADLRFALNQGHGEFSRVVASPGTFAEAYRVTAELMDIAWRFQAVGIVLTEKHLSECSATVELDVEAAAWPAPSLAPGDGYRRYTVTDDGVSPMLFPPSAELIKWSSYEHDEYGVTTEEGETIVRMHDKRNRKLGAIEEYIKDLSTVVWHGDPDAPLIFTYGSTTMSVLEAVRAGGLNAAVVQLVYLEPFPLWELEGLRGSRPVVVEQSSTGQFETLLREKAGIEALASIRRYDGRPFEPLELARELEEVLS
jgi:2-oxoglutarate ferredoxin oxidoreductase subunit alpha